VAFETDGRGAGHEVEAVQLFDQFFHPRILAQRAPAENKALSTLAMDESRTAELIHGPTPVTTDRKRPCAHRFSRNGLPNSRP
jgi:hypothetical protein